ILQKIKECLSCQLARGGGRPSIAPVLVLLHRVAQAKLTRVLCTFADHSQDPCQHEKGQKPSQLRVIGNAAFYSCTFFSTIKLKTRSVTGQIATQIPSRSA